MFLDKGSPEGSSNKSGAPGEAESPEGRTRKIVVIDESDYLAIMQWDDDGGKSGDIVYIVIPNSLRNRRQ